MLTKLEIKNYKSICNATIELSPFTLLIGANGAGKSNLISLFKGISSLEIRGKNTPYFHYALSKHFSLPDEEQFIVVENSAQQVVTVPIKKTYSKYVKPEPLLPELSGVRIFRIDPDSAGRGEPTVSDPIVKEDGSGVVQVLDYLKTGDREDLFNTIESRLMEYVPEIEKISFVSEDNSKSLQVREKHIPTPVTVKDLSEGTRFVLTILTILYQEHPPSLICIEDIDRGFHPRLFQQMVELCNDLSRELEIQIIATTHNPYILDEFVGNESAVVIVEKKEGCTTFTTLTERLAQFESNCEKEEMPLGSLWYSGLVGGVPRR